MYHVHSFWRTNLRFIQSRVKRASFTRWKCPKLAWVIFGMHFPSICGTSWFLIETISCPRSPLSISWDLTYWSQVWTSITILGKIRVALFHLSPWARGRWKSIRRKCWKVQSLPAQWSALWRSCTITTIIMAYGELWSQFTQLARAPQLYRHTLVLALVPPHITFCISLEIHSTCLMKALPVPSVDCLSVIVGFEGWPYFHACTILTVTVNDDATWSHQICSFPPDCIIHNYSRLRSEVWASMPRPQFCSPLGLI